MKFVITVNRYTFITNLYEIVWRIRDKKSQLHVLQTIGGYKINIATIYKIVKITFHFIVFYSEGYLNLHIL